MSPVITILTEVLEDLRSDSKFQSTKRLSIQFDGSSENWNQSFLGWCHLLVAGRAFDEVTVYRKFTVLVSQRNLTQVHAGLPPGHTHEDVDALFSLIKQALVGKLGKSQGTRIVLLRTVQDMCEFLRGIFTNGLTKVVR